MFENLLVKLAKELNRNKIDYMVIGGQAVLIYGEPRMTRDIDITLGLSVDNLNEVLKIVEKLNLKPLVNDIEKFVKDTYVLPLIDENSKIRVDFIFSWTMYERKAMKKVNEIKVGRTKVRFASLEDVIIQKIVSGRERDIEDIKSILVKNPDFDEKYILKWLGEFEKVTKEKILNRFKKIKKGGAKNSLDSKTGLN